MTRVLAWIGLTVIGYALVGTILHFPGSLDDVGPEPGPLVFGAVTGLLIGAVQLPALRGSGPRVWLWPLATAAGIAVTHGLGDGLPSGAGYLPVAVGGGVALGVLQALVLRSPAWPVVTAIAFVVGIVGGHALAVELGFGSIFEEDTFPRHGIMAALTGAIYAAGTAPLFARFRRNSGLPILGTTPGFPTPIRSGRNS